MIAREKFFTYLQKLEIAYSPKLKFNQNLVDLWYESFADCDERDFNQAVNQCIRENEFPPTIATLMKFYKEIKEEKDNLKELIKHQYTTIRSIWGEQYNKETHQAIIDYIMRFPRKMRGVEMIELTHRVVSFSHDCDGVGRKDKPTIKDYLRGAR